jgi:hypothetical protein
MSGNRKAYGPANPYQFDAFNLVARVSCPKDMPDSYCLGQLRACRL